MAYNNIVTRSEAQSLIPEDVSREIIQDVPKQSYVMQLARKLPNIPRRVHRMPVLDVMPTADFVAETGGFSGGNTSGPAPAPTTEANWTDKYIYAESMSVTVPIPEAVLEDQDYDLWGEIRPRLVEAFGIKFDQTVLWAGLGSYTKPTDWENGIAKQAFDAGNYVTIGAGTDLYDDLLGEGGVWQKVEEDGYMPTGALVALTFKAKLRGVRGSDGTPIFNRMPGEAMAYEIDGVPAMFPANGAFDTAQGHLVVGDWRQLLYAFRQDITYKILDQAALFDGSGNLQYSLAQQNMIALRATLRVGWATPNPKTRLNATSSRYPFAYLKA